MKEPFKILQIGFGAIGRTITQEIIERENLELVGVVDLDPNLQNKIVEDILSVEADSKTTISDNLEKVLHELSADIALILTSSSLENVAETISTCLQAGMNVLSLCEELSFPYKRYPEISSKINQIACNTEKSVLGTGINPGFLMDLLPVVLSAPCLQVDSIRVTRVINSSRRRASFQKKIGTGMTQEDFRIEIDEGRITGHVGLVESMQMIDAALHLELDQTLEMSPEPVLATENTKTSFTAIDTGEVLGLKSRAIGKRGSETIIELNFSAYAHASPEYDEVKIEGKPNLLQRIDGGLHGDLGTIAMVVNSIPLVVKAKPGLLTMIDIPIPRNTREEWKTAP